MSWDRDTSESKLYDSIESWDGLSSIRGFLEAWSNQPDSAKETSPGIAVEPLATVRHHSANHRPLTKMEPAVVTSQSSSRSLYFPARPPSPVHVAATGNSYADQIKIQLHDEAVALDAGNPRDQSELDEGWTSWTRPAVMAGVAGPWPSPFLTATGESTAASLNPVKLYCLEFVIRFELLVEEKPSSQVSSISQLEAKELHIV
ncbi:hypothetical protein G7046_g4009 [Stylonectria norvegica]|nr:hypothetical protein G7046_g4009 [Stylonectria norvegica]